MKDNNSINLQKAKVYYFLIEKGDSIIIEKEEKLSPKTNIKTKQ